MNVSDFTYLLQHPEKVVLPVQTNQLEDILEEYPYFQAARAIHLKGLKNLNSYKYNNALKTTAAYTTDRDILFDFITSPEFLQHTVADQISGKAISLNNTETIAEEVEPNPDLKTFQENDPGDYPLPQNITEAKQILDSDLFESKKPEDLKITREENDLNIGAPITFTKKEKYSFVEWLQLTSPDSAQKETELKSDNAKATSKKEDAVKKKFDLIDKFIQGNPKIVPTDEKKQKVNIKASLKIDKNELMTETLAKVYLEQKKYKKAIQAFKILSLKYPEKSGFFADRIKSVEKIQKENS